MNEVGPCAAAQLPDCTIRQRFSALIAINLRRLTYRMLSDTFSHFAFVFTYLRDSQLAAFA
jgi:hypothetical protein